MIKLTDRQREILNVIRGHIAAHGYPPTLREIADATGISSNNGVADHLHALEHKGWITRTRKRSRAIRLVEVAP